MNTDKHGYGEKIIVISIRVAFLLAVLIGGYVQAQVDSNLLWLGVVRADKTIVPFALFDGSSWSNPWPKGEQDDPRVAPDTTLTLDRIPKAWYAPFTRMPREWNVRTTSGGFSAVTVTRPATVYSWCVTYWGLLIGNAEIPVDRHTTVLLEGFAASANIQTGPAVTVGKGSLEWDRLLAFIKPVFEKAEEEYRHPLPSTERAKAELVLTRLDRADPGADGRSVYYFEIERDYVKTNQLPARSEFARSCMTGWIVADRTGTLTIIERTWKNEIPAGDIRITRINPLGTVTIGGKTLWVVQNQYYEGESYSVLEIGQSGVRVVIDTYGGGC